MECYEAERTDESMQFSATWLEIEDLVLSAVSQKKKGKYWIISLIGSV